MYLYDEIAFWEILSEEILFLKIFILGNFIWEILFGKFCLGSFISFIPARSGWPAPGEPGAATRGGGGERRDTGCALLLWGRDTGCVLPFWVRDTPCPTPTPPKCCLRRI